MLCSDDEFSDLRLFTDDSLKIEKELRKKKIWNGFAICPYYLQHLRKQRRYIDPDTGNFKCPQGNTCPYRHTRGEKSIVCKHWLRGLCKKDDDCEFLHMYDMSKLPDCHFFATFGQCKNAECLFLHLKDDELTKECVNYNRGFCRKGPKCENKHIVRVLCPNYLLGFCINGPNCKYGHPKFNLINTLNNNTNNNLLFNTYCALCGRLGHKASTCNNSNNINNNNSNKSNPPPLAYTNTRLRPLHAVTCYKCGQKGHYANTCMNEKVAAPEEGWDELHRQHQLAAKLKSETKL